MGVIAFLFFWTTISCLVSLPSGKAIIDLAWLPFRPIAIGLFAGVVVLLPVAPLGYVLGAKMLTMLEIYVFAAIMSSFGLIAYWAPVAYFVRKFAGDKVKISLL